MKKTSLALATAAAALLSVGAHADGLIAGVAVGQSHLNIDCTGTTECKDNTTGVKLMGGYKWDNGLAVEVSYIDFGTFSFSATDSGLTANLDAKPYSIGLSAAYYVPLAQDWSASVRLGVATTHTSLDANVSGGGLSGSGSDSDNHTDVLGGVALSYSINKALKLDLALDATRAAYQNQGVDTKNTVRLLSLGASYQF
jgi:OOP family OmpA-OmpF porin